MISFPIPENEKERVQALRNYDILDSLEEEDFDSITEAASLICDTPISLISLIDENRQWFKSKKGIDTVEMSRDISFCQYTILNDSVFQVNDTAKDSRFVHNPLVTGDPNIAFYAGYPLIDPRGYALGALCVIDKKPKELNEKQKRLLELLAKQVVTLILERKNTQEAKYFSKLFDISKDLISSVTSEGIIKMVNPAFQDLLGWRESELLGKRLLTFVYPDDIRKTEDELSDRRSGKNTIHFTNRLLAKDGSNRTIQWSVTPNIGENEIFVVGRDMTEETLKNQELEISENKLRSFFENSQGLMCTHDLAGNILSVNQAGAAILGYKKEEILGMSLFDLVPPYHHEFLKGYLNRIKLNRKDTGLMKTLHKDGQPLFWLYNNVLEQDAEGNDYIIGNAIDMTERLKLEGDLKKTKEMLEQTNRVAQVGGWEVDLTNNRIIWSDVTKSIHEVAVDYEPTIEQALDFYEDENRAYIEEAFQEAVTKGIPYDLELQLRTAKKRLIWVRSHGQPEMIEGVCKRIFGTFQDIDQKKRAEVALIEERARLRTFIEHAPAAVAMLDKDLRYIAVSKRWYESYHLADVSIIGKSHYDVFPNLPDDWKEIHKKCLNGEVHKKNDDVWTPPGWDHEQHLIWEIRPWRHFNNEVGGLVMFTQDITESFEKSEELRKAKKIAEQASKAKSEFLANMSHEIRTPLNGVIGFTDLILKTSLNDTQKQYLTIVNDSAVSLLAIINDILDFSKIEAGKLELNSERIDLFDLSEQVINVITYQAQKKGLELILDMSPHLPRFIWADDARLKQILINLLGNAVKFTEIGEIELKIEEVQISASDNKTTLRFSVTDTGIGIQRDKQHEIFEAFAQEDSTITKKYGGTGLGLTISNKLLALMGSHLQLESEVGIGSTFFFNLETSFELGDPAGNGDLNDLQSVLIVDDNDHNRMILERMLALKNIHSESVSNGFDALQKLYDNKKYDLLIVDYQMPILDGLEVIRKIRQSPKVEYSNIPIILLYSSSEDEDIVKQSNELTVTRVRKPINTKEMYEALKRTQKIDVVNGEESDRLPSKAVVRPFNVLIAEDNAVNMLLTSTIIERIAPLASIEKAENGLLAVEACKVKMPDLIFMDIQMPELNGIEATRSIRSLPSGVDVIIIALTAGNVKGEMEKCLDAGFNDFIAKPIVEADIELKIKTWLFKEKTDEITVDLHVDYHMMDDYAAGDEMFKREFIKLTISELEGTVKKIEQAQEEQDLQSLKKIGHKLLGTSRTAGLLLLNELAEELERADSIVEITRQDLLRKIFEEIKIVKKIIGITPFN
ncbi:PAS domain S-box protein [Olivibacter sp. SA151]|uniref:PAS domain S-box protein n=1 Tax=Olivibacter jilunii TaxID=985016 RepID=UPI003F17D3E7